MKKTLLFALLTTLITYTQAQVCFVPRTDYGAGNGPYGVITADVNEDGKLDLISVNSSSNDISVLLGDGLGSFGTATSFTVGSNARYLCAADFNSDNHLDIVIPSFGGGTGIVFGDGAGNFGPFTTLPGVTSGGICAADFNHDGFNDIAIANYGANSVDVLLGDGTGAFAAAVSYGAGAGSTAVTTTDLNNDGNLDLAVTNWTSNNVSILLGTGTGTFGPKTNHTVGTAPVSVAAGDFDSNGFMDLATVNTNSWNVSLLLNSGGGVYTTSTYSLNYNNPDWITLGDFNSDGKLDIAVNLNNINSAGVLLGNGAGSFGPLTTFSVDYGPRGICSGDFNADGKPDLATANNGGFDVSVLLGATAATVTATATSDTVCLGTVITLSGAGAVSYTWTGGAINGATFTPSYSQTYTVTGANANGCTDTDTIRIKVNQPPTVNGASNGPVCEDQTLNFSVGTNAGTNAVFSWSGPNSFTSAIQNPFITNVTLAAAGTYTIMVTDSNNCSVSNSFIVQINPLPMVTASGATVCLNSPINLSSNGANTYSWGGPNGFTSSMQNPVILNATPGMAGVYGVVGTSVNGCVNTATATVVVNPTPTVTAGASATTVCLGSPVTLTGGGANNYTWAPSGTVINGVPFSATNSQTYTVTGSDLNNCTNTAMITVNVVVPAIPSICLVTVDSLSLNNVIVWEKTSFTNADSFFVYRDTANNAYGLIGKVPYDSLSIFTDTVRHKYAANGDPRASSWRYKIAIKDTCGNISAKSPYHQSIFIQNNSGNFSWSDYKIEGQSTPVPALSNYLFKRDNFATGSYSIIQTLSASSTSYTDGQYATYQATADWRIETQWSISCTPTLRSGNNSVNSAIVRSKSNITNNRGIGIKQLSPASIQFAVYPNPANTTLTVECKLIDSAIEISDVLGNSVKHLKMFSEKTSVDISDLQNGIYFVTLKGTDGKASATGRIVVQH